jgi:sphingomyelin phosphodiesterase acid-like 3
MVRITSCLFYLVTLILFWGPGPRAFSASPPAGPSGNVLLLSDIHFDPLADPAVVRQLIAAPVARWHSIFASSGKTDFARSPHDTNYPLLNSALSAGIAQAPFDFVVVAGDYLRHDFQRAFIGAGGSPSEFSEFATTTALFVVDSVQVAFGIPVYFALGNDDSTCGDYHLDPGGPFLDALASSLHVLAHHPDAAMTFRTAGFYEVPHPTLPNQEIIVLNSVLWSRNYVDCGSDRGDLGAAEIDWLSSKLSRAKMRGQKVILVMHIPPGINAYRSSRSDNCSSVAEFWRGRYASRFLNLIQSYGETVQIALAGHTHMDDFRVLAASNATPAVALRMTPAISPIFGNNPAFSILHYHIGTGAVSDIATYDLDLSSGRSNPRWALEYRFSTAYGYHSVTPANLAVLAARIRDEPNVRRTFVDYYAASGRSAITSANWPFFSCAETHLTPKGYRDCVCHLQATSTSPGSGRPDFDDSNP